MCKKCRATGSSHQAVFYLFLCHLVSLRSSVVCVCDGVQFTRRSKLARLLPSDAQCGEIGSIEDSGSPEPRCRYATRVWIVNLWPFVSPMSLSPSVSRSIPTSFQSIEHSIAQFCSPNKQKMVKRELPKATVSIVHRTARWQRSDKRSALSFLFFFLPGIGSSSARNEPREPFFHATGWLFYLLAVLHVCIVVCVQKKKNSAK